MALRNNFQVSGSCQEHNVPSVVEIDGSSRRSQSAKIGVVVAKKTQRSRGVADDVDRSDVDVSATSR